MSTTGLLSPITVADAGNLHVVPGKDPLKSYTLIAGSRRLAAAKKLGWETIPAFVRENTTQVDRTVINIGENALRKDLTTYEMARACSELRNQVKSEGGKITLAEIGKRAGLSIPRVQQLTAAFDTLPGEIKERWKKEGTAQDDGPRIMTTSFITELVKLQDPDKQLKAFKEEDALIKKLYEDGEGKPKTRADGKKKTANAKKSLNVKLDRYKKVCKAVKGQKAEVQIMQVVEYLIGETDSVPGLIDDSPKETKKGKDK